MDEKIDEEINEKIDEKKLVDEGSVDRALKKMLPTPIDTESKIKEMLG